MYFSSAVDKLCVPVQHRAHPHDEAASLHHLRDHTVQVRLLKSNPKSYQKPIKPSDQSESVIWQRCEQALK